MMNIMRINDIRLANLEFVIETQFDGNKTEFCRSTGFKTTGIAKWWSENDKRNISNKSAEKIEKALKLNPGSFDTPIFQLNEKKATYSIGNEIGRIPVLGGVQMDELGQWDIVNHGEKDGFINLPSNDPNAYALKLGGDTMRPAIKSGWYAVCEPIHEPTPGEFVHVTLKDGKSMVKELLILNDNQIVLDSVNEDNKRITLEPEQIETLHHAFIVPPSKHSL